MARPPRPAPAPPLPPVYCEMTALLWMAACAAASLAMGSRSGEHET